MASQEKGSVRMGPITLIALVVILCMAVLAVLAVTTSQANYTQALRQSESIAATYANEKSGQELLAQVDACLAEVAQEGGSVQDALMALKSVLPSTAVTSGKTVRVAFATNTGHTLNITLSINDDLTYTITKWKSSTEWDESYLETDTLWSGN